jgi:prepilin-type processing-associated H-X9-DG protein
VIYDKWQFYGMSGVYNLNNMQLIDRLIIPVYNCPSSPLPTLSTYDDMGFTGPKIKRGVSNYVGIAGAYAGLIPNYTESRVNNVSGIGTVGGGGTLIPNGKLRFADLTDGTSNVIAVGEQGDWIWTLDGTTHDWRETNIYGWAFGLPTTTTPPNFDPGGNITCQSSMATVRYAVNQKRGWANGGAGCGSTGVCELGLNIPLNSAHPGGINALLGDGSVRFLSDSTPLDLLARLATRDDGQPLGSF